MENLSSRTAQEVLDDHLNLAKTGGPRGTSSISSRRIYAATHQRT
jgi:hypothetical protein